MIKRKLKSLAITHYDSVLLLSTSLATLLVFLSGLGRYRVIIIFSVFFLFRAVFSYFKIKPTVLFIILLPLFIFFLIRDVEHGQFLSLFPDLHIIVSIISLVAIEALLRLGTTYLLKAYSESGVFRVCPECNHDNRCLVKQCDSCSYMATSDYGNINNNFSEPTCELPENIKEIIEINKKNGLLLKPGKRLLNSIKLKSNEVLLLNIRIFPKRSFFKDGERKTGSNFVLTTERVVFIGLSLISGGWRFKDACLLDQVTEVSVEMKRLVTKKEPVLSIRTDRGLFELYFLTLFSFRNKIKMIADSMKYLKPDLPINVDLPEDHHRIKLEW